MLETIIFKPGNPYAQYYTHGVLNSLVGNSTAIGFYVRNEFKHAESYDRYLMSVSKGRILCMAEYDAILRSFKEDKDISPSPMKTTLKTTLPNDLDAANSYTATTIMLLITAVIVLSAVLIFK